MKILVVDDDPELITLLQISLQNEGWEVVTAMTGEEAIQLVKEERPELAILDIMLPGISGIDLCKFMAVNYAVPVIMLSARAAIEDKVECLNIGADDYLTKPFGIEELVARVRAVLRRNQSDEINSASPFLSKNLTIDFKGKCFIYRKTKIDMTVTESKLMMELVSNRSKVLSYNFLLGKIWGPKYKIEREYLHTYIARLRAKIASLTGNKQYIFSKRNVGYYFYDSDAPGNPPIGEAPGKE